MQHKISLQNSEVRSYYQLIHYSPDQNLSTIDPQFYGTSTLRTKLREGGVDKSYFYTLDNPESCVASGLKRRYVVYIPTDWKALIYDIGQDIHDLYEHIKQQIKLQLTHENREPYHYEINDRMQIELKKLGYKGFTNSLSTLPHVLTLFYAIPTAKPSAPSIIYDWSDNIVEKNEAQLSASSSNFSLFSANNQKHSCLSEPILANQLTQINSQPVIK